QRAVEITRGHGQPPRPGSVKKGNTTRASELSPCWGAQKLPAQGKLAFGLCHIAEVEITRVANPS
ncbi:hypothetical protein, partial [Mesorhizobium sp. f-mel]